VLFKGVEITHEDQLWCPNLPLSGISGSMNSQRGKVDISCDLCHCSPSGLSYGAKRQMTQEAYKVLSLNSIFHFPHHLSPILHLNTTLHSLVADIVSISCM
jgi:hypothetical protein